MSHDRFDTPLNENEFVEFDELLCMLDEDNLSMNASQADGFMTAVLLLPEEVSPREWMPLIFASPDADARLLDQAQQDRLEELTYRRYREINRTLATCKPIDPIVFDPEDENGNPLEGEEEIIALQPFASGFLTAAQTWSGLLDNEDPTVSSALVGIWRHLPDDEIGDFLETRQTLLSESPLENLDDAITDIATSVAEIATITRGFKPKKTDNRPRTRSGKKASNR